MVYTTFFASQLFFQYIYWAIHMFYEYMGSDFGKTGFYLQGTLFQNSPSCKDSNAPH